MWSACIRVRHTEIGGNKLMVSMPWGLYVTDFKSYSTSLKWKCHFNWILITGCTRGCQNWWQYFCSCFDEIFVSCCTGSCRNENIQCSQLWKFYKNDDISVAGSVFSFLCVFWWGREWLISLMISESSYKFAAMRQRSNHGEDMGQLINRMLILPQQNKEQWSWVHILWDILHARKYGSTFEYFVIWSFSYYHMMAVFLIEETNPSLLNCAHFLDEMERWSLVARG